MSEYQLLKDHRPKKVHELPPKKTQVMEESSPIFQAVKIQLTTPVLLRVVLVSMQIWPEGVELGSSLMKR